MSQHNPPQNLYLKRLRLENMRGFKDADISFVDEDGGFRQMTIVLGANGSGKSTLLRALAVGLCQQKEASRLIGALSGDFVRINRNGNRADKAVITLDLFDPENPEEVYWTCTEVERDDSGQETLDKTTSANFPWSAIFTCGYGVNRGTGQRSEQAPSTYSRSDALATLFDDNAALVDPEDTLRALKLASLGDEDPTGKGEERFQKIQNHLKALLQLQPAYTIDVTSKEVKVSGAWGRLPFHALGDGYRGTSGWFLDLCRRAHIADRLPIDGLPAGIVLIDEIDEHLHPRWKKGLIPILRKRFPRLQFVGTTHSAMSIVNCTAAELWASELKHTVASLHDLGGPAGHTADTILRGEWFGLTSTLDDGSEKILKRYQEAVQKGRPEAEVAPLREALRLRLGRLVESPLDELALEIAAEVRRQAAGVMTPEQRKVRIQDAARVLRQRLQEGGFGLDRDLDVESLG